MVTLQRRRLTFAAEWKYLFLALTFLWPGAALSWCDVMLFPLPQQCQTGCWVQKPLQRLSPWKPWVSVDVLYKMCCAMYAYPGSGLKDLLKVPIKMSSVFWPAHLQWDERSLPGTWVTWPLPVPFQPKKDIKPLTNQSYTWRYSNNVWITVASSGCWQLSWLFRPLLCL